LEVLGIPSDSSLAEIQPIISVKPGGSKLEGPPIVKKATRNVYCLNSRSESKRQAKHLKHNSQQINRMSEQNQSTSSDLVVTLKCSPSQDRCDRSLLFSRQHRPAEAGNVRLATETLIRRKLYHFKAQTGLTQLGFQDILLFISQYF
jgi:hypothetical protein